MYESVGIVGRTRTVACDVCDADVSCFAPATKSMSARCRCRCIRGVYGDNCLPVRLPRPVGCNRIPAAPQSSYTASVSLSVSEAPGWSDVPCPTLSVATATGGRLTHSDIRNGGETPPLLVVALPPPFRWASDPSLSTYMSFVLGSPKQPHGFSGPWGDMLRNATWERSATSPYSVLEVGVPVYSGYFIGVDEKILVLSNGTAVYGGCRGALVGPFTVVSGTPPSLINALAIIIGIVAGVATVAFVITGGLGPILEIQTLGVFARMSCATVHERAICVALPYFLSVFAALDLLWMVVGNALVAVVFGCLHYALTVAYRRRRGVGTASAWAVLRFPNLAYLVACLMYLGIFVCSVFMLATPNAGAAYYVLGVFGALCGLAFQIGVYYFITHYTGVSFTKYWKFSKKPPHKRWLYPVGYWCPTPQEHMYGSVFTTVRGSYAYWCLFRLTVLCLAGIIAAVQPPVGKCHIPYFCMAVVLLAGASVLALTNMMRSTFLTVMHTIGFVLMAVLCLVNAANYLSPNNSGVKAYVAIIILLMFVLLAISVYVIVVWWYEHRQWKMDVGVGGGTASDLERAEEVKGEEGKQVSEDNAPLSSRAGTETEGDAQVINDEDLVVEDDGLELLNVVEADDEETTNEVPTRRRANPLRSRRHRTSRGGAPLFYALPEDDGGEI
ncbi:dispersed gene family protein 1 (DGF-1) [Trypanosoma grayi]|uniref:dispersed gene family protein 1 (DGF-1) n=1 Tax=Trypanosoma grayi TaxID=71804 RepID=UPI0004F40F1E|nr:dispersed gene family protein 1 (DGF-1) [Trypanosoma grayi]KEG08875.1 dispersed gene family protein 1 (DGF-1) [Trypanosoma grayi]